MALSTLIRELYPASGGTESFALARKSGWILLTDLDRKTIIRRFGLRYLSTDIVTVYIYVDGDDSTVIWTGTYPANVSGDEFLTLRVSRRARYLMYEITTPASSNYNTHIRRIEIEVDD